jgi:hypothetical protein
MVIIGKKSSEEKPSAAKPTGRLTCAECQYDRPPTSLARRISELVADAAPDDISETYNYILRNETDMAPRERAEYTRLINENDADKWSIRPKSHSYCGRHEAQGKWFVQEVKNQFGSDGSPQCVESRPRDKTSGTRACSTCRYNWVPSSDLLPAVISQLRTIGHETEPAVQDVIKAMNAICAREVAGAQEGHGILRNFDRATFLPVCSKYSEGHDLLVGPLLNVGGDCDGWEPLVSGRPTLGPRHSEALQILEANRGRVWPGSIVGARSEAWAGVFEWVRAALDAMGYGIGKAGNLMAKVALAINEENKVKWSDMPSVPKIYGR